jgi:hypothetical protein
MKNSIYLLSALTLLAVSPAFAKVGPDFPSRSIRPIVSTTETEPSAQQVAPQRRVTPLPERFTAPNPRHCAKPFVARDATDNADRHDCQPENAVGTKTNIPQLRAFRQPTTQRFAH